MKASSPGFALLSMVVVLHRKFIVCLKKDCLIRISHKNVYRFLPSEERPDHNSGSSGVFRA
jgi:hypothetical protein